MVDPPFPPPRRRRSPPRRPRSRGAASVAAAAAVVAAVAVLLPPPRPAAAHSSITHPPPDSWATDCRIGTAAGVARNCPGPCPDFYLKPYPPVTVYRRGQRALWRWRRNNHEGGFLRWSLVPLHLAANAAAHERFAFETMCWATGKYTCATEEESRVHCVGDQQNSAYKAEITVPPVVPDGTYILSMVWYGGVRLGTHESTFGDYYSCSRVAISGGAPLAPSFSPVFDPAAHTAGAARSCDSSTDTVGQCRTEPCRTASGGPRFVGRPDMVPSTFAAGRSPPPLTPALYARGADWEGPPATATPPPRPAGRPSATTVTRWAVVDVVTGVAVASTVATAGVPTLNVGSAATARRHVTLTVTVASPWRVAAVFFIATAPGGQQWQSAATVAPYGLGGHPPAGAVTAAPKRGGGRRRWPVWAGATGGRHGTTPAPAPLLVPWDDAPRGVPIAVRATVLGVDGSTSAAQLVVRFE